MAEVAITGLGLVTPLGCIADGVLDRILQGERAIQPAPFSPPLACRHFAPVMEFDADRYFPDNKNLRLMNRDAQMAVVAARLALGDARIVPGELYPAEEIALYGATGLSGMPPADVAHLVQHAAAADGSLDLRRFGEVALRRIRPVLSFKILSNMPICFVSIFENLRGPNAVYTPWEGQGAEAIAAGMEAVASGETPCAVVGGCDVKTHWLSFLSLQQLGLFDSWRRNDAGIVPGEGACFLVLEEWAQAIRRGARVYAVLRGSAARPVSTGGRLEGGYADILRRLNPSTQPLIVAAGEGDAVRERAECAAMDEVVPDRRGLLRPKAHLGNLFAAAAAVQTALAAAWAARQSAGVPVLAHCFGPGSEQAAFALEAV
jgi:3-oxoacyl-[acyl-carrier-protein] synthase II